MGPGRSRLHHSHLRPQREGNTVREISETSTGKKIIWTKGTSGLKSKINDVRRAYGIRSKAPFVPKAEFDPEYLGCHTDFTSRWKPFQRKVITMVADILSQSAEDFAATFRPRIYWVCPRVLDADHMSASGTGSGKTSIFHYLHQVMEFSPDQIYKPTLRATTGAIDTSSFMEYNAERVILIDDIVIHKDDSGVLRYKHDFLTMLRKVTDCVPFSARFGMDVNEIDIRAITVVFSNQAPPEDPAVRSRLKWIDIPEEDAIDHRKEQRTQSSAALDQSSAGPSTTTNSTATGATAPLGATYGGFEPPPLPPIGSLSPA